jgi:hypothetical protein
MTIQPWSLISVQHDGDDLLVCITSDDLGPRRLRVPRGQGEASAVGLEGALAAILEEISRRETAATAVAGSSTLALF